MCVQVIDMLTDIASECQEKHVETAATAALSVSLAWAHIGEQNRAKSMHAEAAALGCTAPHVLDLVSKAGEKLGVVTATA